MGQKTGIRYEFGAFYLDEERRHLLCNGRPVHLTTKVFDVLCLLVQAKGEVVEKEVFMSEVWPNSFVEESNLVVCIYMLRKALGESQDNIKYIETVTGRGYRFVAKVAEIEETTKQNEGTAPIKFTATDAAVKQDVLTRLLAVLPVTNSSGDPLLEYLVDGITENIIRLLSRQPKLRVVSRNTILRYKDREIDAQEVGKELNAHVVLLGKLIKLEGRLFFQAELINIEDGTQLWSEQYNHPLTNILEAQEKIAASISKELRVKLSIGKKKRLIKRYTENTEAYDLYLKGRYFWNKYAVMSVKKGLEYFQQAIEVDPFYAPAYSGIADSYFRLSGVHLSPKVALPKAREAAHKAVALDDSLSEAHTSLGMAKTWYDYDWVGASKDFKRAIELNPNASIAHQRYGEYLIFMERFDEALAELELARSLDPLSLWINVSLGTNLFLMHRYQQATGQLEKTLEIDPAYYPAHFCLGMVYLQQRRYEAALAEFEQVRQIGEESSLVWGFIGLIYALSGERDKARKVLEHLIEASKQVYVSPYGMALIYTGLGERGRALDWLEELYQERNEWVLWLRIAPEFNELRSDARFTNLLLRIGLRELVTDRGEGISSMAVLPLANISDDPNMDYLADGITETLINNFGQIPQLSIIANNTVQRYKGQIVDAQSIGQELNVQAVLLGKVLAAGHQLTISTELVNVADGRLIWGERYSRPLSDIFLVQEEIAQEIIRKLRIKLNTEEKIRLTRRYTENTEAYRLYLKGRYCWNKRTEEDLKKGVDYFKRAVEIDPNYALAYAGLADGYNLLSSYGFIPLEGSIQIIETAARKGLEIDPKLAEPHATLGLLKISRLWDWLEGEKELKLAIALNPNYLNAHLWYGVCLRALGRFDESLFELRRAQELEPFSLVINTAIGAHFYFGREYETAISQLQETLELDHNYYATHFFMGKTYERMGLYEEALSHLEKAVYYSSFDPEAVGYLGYTLARTGGTARAQELLDKLKELSEQKYVQSSALAVIYLGLGEIDRMFEYLEKAVNERNSWLITLNIEPRMDELRSDPRFIAFINRIGLTAQ